MICLHLLSIRCSFIVLSMLNTKQQVRSSLIILGILLGKVTSDSTEVSDSIPLFHTNILVPSLELAFEMVMI